MNCGRCGRQIFKAGEVICDFCKKTVVKDATRHANKMNMRKEQEEELFQTMAHPGEEEDAKKSLRDEHFTDTHDASAVWAKGDDKKHRR